MESKEGRHPEETLVDLSKKSDEELRQLLDELCAEEEQVSLRRRVLHGKIDILRAELVHRLKTRHEAGQSVFSGADVKKLSEILARGSSGVSSPTMTKSARRGRTS